MTNKVLIDWTMFSDPWYLSLLLYDDVFCCDYIQMVTIDLT